MSTAQCLETVAMLGSRQRGAKVANGMNGLISCIYNKEVILDYPGGPHVTAGTLNRRQRMGREPERCQCKQGSTHRCQL